MPTLTLHTAAPSNLRFHILNYTRSAALDSVAATVHAWGDPTAIDALLGQAVEIVDAGGQAVWHGTVQRIARPDGTRTLIRTLDGRHNRVRVRYSTSAPGEGGLATEWAENATAAGRYGVREAELRSRVGGPLAGVAAEVQRDRALSALSLPEVTTTASRTTVAELTLRGAVLALDDRRMTATTGAADGRITHEFDLSTGYHALGRGRTATSLSFAAAGSRLNDSAYGLGVGAGEWLRISGAGANNGVRQVLSVGKGDWAALSGVIADAAAGPSVRYDWHGTRLAQAVTLDADVPFRASAVQIGMRRVGAPSAGLTISLCADAAGSPGAVLTTVTLVADEIVTTTHWHQVVFAPPVDLTYGATYWLVLACEPTIPDLSSYFQVSLDLTASAGDVRLWDGAGWTARGATWGAASLRYRLLGGRDTAAIAADVLRAYGLFDVVTYEPSGLDGDPGVSEGENALARLESLLEAGTAEGRKLGVRVGRGWARVVALPPYPADGIAPYRLGDGGGIETVWGVGVEGVVGAWVDVGAGRSPSAAGAGGVVWVGEGEVAARRSPFAAGGG